MLKRVAIMLFCLIMILVATFGFVVGVVAVPTIYSYAETTNNFEPIRDQSDAVYAFQAYCKSRDLTIEGSIADAVTSYTTDAYNHTCNKIGVNPTELQAQIQAEYDQTGKPIKFLFSSTGVDVFNRLFSQFLQDNELQVGDTVNNKIVYSGKYYDGSLVWITDLSLGLNSVIDSSHITAIGSYYKYTTNDCVALSDSGTREIIFNINNTNYGIPIFHYTKNDYNGRWIGYWFDTTFGPSKNSGCSISNNLTSLTGVPCIWYSTNTQNYYLGVGTYVSLFSGNTVDNYFGKCFSYALTIPQNDVQNANVFITTNNLTINNNIYEGDTIINYEGDVINEPDPVPPGGTDPGWDIGGGGGTATDGNGNTWNIQFPDFELPDLNIDWSINGLGEKFPFSIPFDLVALVTVLNAEPQAPRFEGTVNFGFTTWDYDINLQQFDSVAQACRIAELLLLVVGLILVTRSIIKG